MDFRSNRGKAAALVALVFVLGIAFGVVGMLAGRRVLGAKNRGSSNGAGGQQISQLARALRLTPDQERQFRQILADTGNRYDAIHDSMNPQFRQVREQNQQRIREILAADQRPLFEDFLHESRGRRNEQLGAGNRRNDTNGRNGRGDQAGGRSDPAPMVTRLTQELRLTADQQTQLSGILRDTRASFDALRQQMDPQFEQVRLSSREHLREVVTAEQRPRLEAFFQQRDEERRRK